MKSLREERDEKLSSQRVDSYVLSKSERLLMPARRKSLAVIFQLLLQSVQFNRAQIARREKIDNPLSAAIGSENTSPSNSATVTANGEQLLDCALARPDLLTPNEIVEGFSRVLKALVQTGRSTVTFDEFVEQVESMMRTGALPPLNMLLAIPERVSTNTDHTPREAELAKECTSGPSLTASKKVTDRLVWERIQRNYISECEN